MRDDIPIINVWCPFCKERRHVSHGRIAAHTLDQEVQAFDKTGVRTTAIATVVCPGVGAMITKVTSG